MASASAVVTVKLPEVTRKLLEALHSAVERIEELEGQVASQSKEPAAPVAEHAPEETAVSIPRYILNGWSNGKNLSGADWRAYIEALPAGEFATTLLSLADAIDRCDGTGLWATHYGQKTS